MTNFSGRSFTLKHTSHVRQNVVLPGWMAGGPDCYFLVSARVSAGCCFGRLCSSTSTITGW
jgi:hypothetical protein